ncbi:hypothetical protein RhiirA5_386078 [Rhizophagus irregularis]|uniref:DUF659 domain-containing protein n=1 Tax=Rhizophagus irregularis TaxID=588596 RepID=A0A2N0NL84_9GLOM|nr:hypothetical protein RhiirA5_386078 [Rhizophagus irregularis]
MTSSEPSENPRKGHYFIEDGKFHVLREHLANHCQKYPQEVSLQFAKIVGYDPSLSDTLLESETSCVNICIMNELSADNNFTIAMDGWTDLHGNNLWAFMLMTGSRKEYLLSLEELSNIHHTGVHLSNVIEEVINKVEAKKFVAIMSDNGSNVAAARKIITNNYPNIINMR